MFFCNYGMLSEYNFQAESNQNGGLSKVKFCNYGILNESFSAFLQPEKVMV